MNVKKFDLYGDGRVKLYAYIPHWTPVPGAYPSRSGVVVLPGGGYLMHGNSEGEPVALAFMAKGFNAYLLKYSIGADAVFPASAADACRALKIIRENAGELHQDPDALCLCGFSAGGHVAACAGTMWNREDVRIHSGCSDEEGKPNALILGYPCITVDIAGMADMYNRLRGERTLEELKEIASAENWVGAHTPPCFLWSAYEDTLVPVEHSLMFQMALAKHNIPFTAHTYLRGTHGSALAAPESSLGTAWYEEQGVARWFEDAVYFLRQLFGNPRLPVPQQPFFPLGAPRAQLGVPSLSFLSGKDDAK